MRNRKNNIHDIIILYQVVSTQVKKKKILDEIYSD